MSCNYFLVVPILEHNYTVSAYTASCFIDLRPRQFADLALIILLGQRRLVTIFTELQLISRTFSTNSRTLGHAYNSGTVGKYACS